MNKNEEMKNRMLEFMAKERESCKARKWN